MKTSTMRFYIAIGITSLLTSLNLMGTSIGDQCAYRIKILENELNNVLQMRHYSFQKRSRIQETKRELKLSANDYKNYIISLKQYHSDGKAALQVDNKEEYRSKMVACLLSSGELVQNLRQIAARGKKSLDDFSKHWRDSFPGYAKIVSRN